MLLRCANLHAHCCSGLWTTPFMSVGAQLWTAADGNVSLRSGAEPLPAGTTADGGLTGLTLTGPVNQAKIVGPSDIGSCKGVGGGGRRWGGRQGTRTMRWWVMCCRWDQLPHPGPSPPHPCPTPHPFTPTPTPLHRTAPHRMPAGYLTMIDTVLLPFDPATLPAGGNGGVAAAVGAPAGCNLQANAGLSNGSSVVLGGATNRQRTGAVGRWQGVVWMKCLSPPLGTHWFAE